MKEAIQKAIEGGYKNKFVELGADLEHDRWAKWQKYMHSYILPSADEGIMQIGSEFIERWGRQINTPYSKLSEKEKESDRFEVRKYEDLIAKHFYLLDPLFWQSLGKSLGWKNETYYFSTGEKRSYGCMFHWHQFIDWIAEKKDVDEFFKELLEDVV